MARTTPTPKQRVFVKETAKGKTYTDAYIKAFDVSPTTKRSTIHEEASRTASLPQVQNALAQLFPLDKTAQVVDNLHKLSISAESQETQVKATKEYLDRALPKTDSGSNINVNIANVVNSDRDKYGL